MDMAPIGQHLHFVGILGSGMNAVAQLACRRGWQVSGSDRFLDQAGNHRIAACLQALGIRRVPQDGSGIAAGVDAIVVSSAIEADNPDCLAAQARGIPQIHRAQALAACLGDGRLIGIAGTSGKTTVTGMMGWLLTELGLDPTVVNGGALIDWRTPDTIGNVRLGAGPWQVVELDESDRSLLRFHPDWAIITNITADHFDLAATRRLFDRFRQQVRLGAVGALDDEPSRPVTPSRPLDLRLPGDHNQANARQCLALCRRLGLDTQQATAALARFNGIERRLERIPSDPAGPSVYDDFAHNPAKLAAAIRAVRPDDACLTVVWQPHGFGPLRTMLDDLTAMFARELRPTDRLLLLPVYDAGGTAQRTIASDDLVAALHAHPIRVTAAPNWPSLAVTLDAMTWQSRDVLLMTGARDPSFSDRVRETVMALDQNSDRQIIDP